MPGRLPGPLRCCSNLLNNSGASKNKDKKQMRSSCELNGYPLVNVYRTMENHPATNGKAHYQWPVPTALLD